MRTLKKGHQPPPNGGIVGKAEPAMEGFSQEEFEKSRVGLYEKGSRWIKEKYKDEMDEELISFYENLGIKKALYDSDRENGLYRYSVFSPLNKIEGYKYPVVYYSHGGMQSAFDAESVGFQYLVAKEQIIVVYPNNGGDSNDAVDTEFPRIIEDLKNNGYLIDEERIYAAGFSSGSDATETIGTTWPELVAAVAPCPGSNAMRNSLVRYGVEYYDKNINLKLPMLCVAGLADFGDRFPYPVEECYTNFNIWMKEICKVCNYEPISMAQSRKISESSSNSVNSAFGIEFHETYTEYFEERKWHVGEFRDENGMVVVRFMGAEGLPHVPTPSHPYLIWEFFKHYSRDAKTKEIKYTPVVFSGMY